jgi:hypothetical protein
MVTMPPCGADPEKRIEERTAAMAEPITIEFTRFSAFYSPLIATFAGGFLQDEGFDVKHRVSPAGKTAIDSLLDGSAQVVQSAPSQGLQSLERGEKPKALHFAQINEKDGFFITMQPSAPAEATTCICRVRAHSSSSTMASLMWSRRLPMRSDHAPSRVLPRRLPG